MLTHRNFSAWITCNGSELVEFAAELNKETHVVTCYVASQPGARFAVHWFDYGSPACSKASIEVDGHKVPGRWLDGYGHAERSTGSERPFTFKGDKGDQTVRSASPSPPATGSEAGIIVLRIKRVKRMRVNDVNAQRETPTRDDDISLSGPTTALTTARWTKYPPNEVAWRTEPYDSSEAGPYVTFEFRYKPKETLFLEHIISPDMPLITSCSLPKDWLYPDRVSNESYTSSLASSLTSSPSMSPRLSEQFQPMTPVPIVDQKLDRLLSPQEAMITADSKFMTIKIAQRDDIEPYALRRRIRRTESMDSQQRSSDHGQNSSSPKQGQQLALFMTVITDPNDNVFEPTQLEPFPLQFSRALMKPRDLRLMHESRYAGIKAILPGPPLARPSSFLLPRS